MSHKFYTWPNPNFPFRLYLDRPECRIFIIENIFHNYDWLKEVKDYIKETDYFLVYVGWNISDYIATYNKKVIEECGLNIDNFYIMHNSYEEMAVAAEYGFQGDLLNHNAWLDENVLTPLDLEKKYDALYVARPSAMKRHQLAKDIKKLALVGGGHNHNNASVVVPPSLNDSSKFYNRAELVEIINESSCGLSLSEEEGASFSTSEYLLCGIPVVSTPSKGGRDFWLNSDNSIIARPSSSSVASAVNEVDSHHFKPSVIRRDHIRKAHLIRNKFISHLSSLFDKYGIKDLDAKKFFHDTFIEKLRGGEHINNVIKIFKKNA